MSSFVRQPLRCRLHKLYCMHNSVEHTGRKEKTMRENGTLGLPRLLLLPVKTMTSLSSLVMDLSLFGSHRSVMMNRDATVCHTHQDRVGSWCVRMECWCIQRVMMRSEGREQHTTTGRGGKVGSIEKEKRWRGTGVCTIGLLSTSFCMLPWSII